MQIPTPAKKQFTKKLAEWHHHHNTRDLPWKGEKDPYRIWLSEVILQQTRALQGLPYYLNFTTTYPTVQALAAANDEDVFRLWQGLGYYNRCKNMLATARIIANELGGKFPNTYDGLLGLKGIGPYTAAAIGSFAFGLPCAVVDGNVYRVLSRYFGIDTPFDTTEGKKQFATLAGELLDKDHSAAHNQAIMDLGATVCLPANPQCTECPLNKNCFAYNNDLISSLPVRSKKVKVRTRHFNYLLLLHKDEIWVHKRGSGDIWENLHQPYLIETHEPADISTLKDDKLFTANKIPTTAIAHTGNMTQRLTHQIINTSFYTINLNRKPDMPDENGIWLSISELKKLAFPKTLVSFLEKYLYF